MKYDYEDIFHTHPDGSASSEFFIRIYGQNVTLSPGTLFKPGMLVGGIDIARMYGHELKATIHEEHEDEVVVIDKFY
ncbi:MAG: hypothetical protein WCT29_01275 [Candidatus Paceibacterota bacterium]|jgi:hypothetical protein